MERFDLEGRVAVVTGGSGLLGFAIAEGLAEVGATVGIAGRDAIRCGERVDSLVHRGLSAFALPFDVTDEEAVRVACERLGQLHGRLDVLVNAAGGHVPGSTNEIGASPFSVDLEATRKVIELNLMGTVMPTMILGPLLERSEHASVINVSSMAATRALSRTPGYSAAKSGVDGFTRWLAVECARHYGERIRVNAIAPGFFVGDQNRTMLTDPDGTPTPRGETILSRTPMGRFGVASDVVGAAVWLASEASRFVTGAVIPVDGGFLADGGV